MKVRKSVWKVKRGKEEQLRAWFRALQNEKRPEAENTLVYENVHKETVFWFEVDGQSYVLYMMRAADDSRPMDMTDPLNQQHKKVLDETMEGPYAVEMLLNLTNPKQSH